MKKRVKSGFCCFVVLMIISLFMGLGIYAATTNLDFDGDGYVTLKDLGIHKSGYAKNIEEYDIDSNSIVDVKDIVAVSIEVSNENDTEFRVLSIY